MPALVILGRRCLIASDDVPLFALPAALFHSAWTIVLLVTLTLYQRHPVCRDEGDYLPFLAGGAGAFTISSVLEWSLFSVGLTGTPLETHARRAVPLLLYFHTAASVAELGFAAYGAHLLHVDTRLCTAWSPRPLAAALVGTSWAVIALNGLLTAMALNPWHGLGLVEAWEARLLWLSRLLCCRSRLLTQARVPDREPALRRIAQLTSHLLQHVDLTLSDVATAMILVAAAQRERRRRALRDAMVAAAAAQRALNGPNGPAVAAAAAAAATAAAGAGPGAPAGLQAFCSASAASGGSAAAPSRLTSSSPGEGAGASEGGAVAGSDRSPFLTVQQPQPTPQPHPHPHPHPHSHLQQPLLLGPHAIGRHHSRARFFAEDGTELGTLHSHAPVGPAAAAPPPPPTTAAPAPPTLLQGSGFNAAAGEAAGRASLAEGSGVAPQTAAFITAAGPSLTFANPLLSPTASHTTDAGGGAAAAAGAGAGIGTAAGGGDGVGSGVRAAAPGSGGGAAAPPRPAAVAALAAEEEEGTLPSPCRAITMMHPIVHITPAGMEEHLDELVGELVGELAAEAAEAEADADGELGAEAGLVAAGQGGGLNLEDDFEVDLELRSKERGEGGQVLGGGAAAAAAEELSARPPPRRLGSEREATVAAVAAAAAVVTTNAATAAAAAAGPAAATAGAGTGPPVVSAQSSLKAAALRKRIGDAALAAAFAAEREMVDRGTLQEAAVYGRYAAAIYGSCPPDGPGKSAAWHLGGDGDGSSPDRDEVAAWRRRHGSSAPDPLLASILSSASRCTEHVVHVNTHNSTEGYLPYMVCLDKPTRSVVIAIRGTFSAEDIVTDCLCEPFDVRHLLHGDTLSSPPSTAAAVPSGAAPPAAAAASAAPAGPADARVDGGGGGGGPADDPLAAAARRTESEEVSSFGGFASVGGFGGFGSTGGGAGGAEPVLVHAGIWAAADVIWEDLRELQLLHILLSPPPPPPGAATGEAGATAGVTTTGTSTAATGSSGGAGTGAATAAAAVAAAAPAGPAVSGPAAGALPSDPASRRRSGSGAEGPPPGAGPRPQPPSSQLPQHQQQQQLRRQQQQQQERPGPPPRRQTSTALPRRRPASLDQDRPSSSFSAVATHLPPPSPTAASATAADPWVASAHSAVLQPPFDVSRRPSSITATHLPRLVSAERQATLPHGTGLGALLQRHRLQQRLPPPPPPAAALLPSLALSYHPPGRTASTPLAAGAAAAATERTRRRRDILPSALRRRSSTTDGGGSGRRRGGGSRSAGGRSSAGEDGDDDNDPSAPLLLSPPPAASAAGTAAGHSYSPIAAAAAGGLLLPSRPSVTLGAAASTQYLGDASSRHSLDLGYALWRGAGLERGTSPSRLASTAAAGAGGGGSRPAGSPPPPLPPPPLPPPLLLHAPSPLRGAPAAAALAGSSPGPSRYALARETSRTSVSWGPTAAAAAPAASSAAAAAPGFFGRLQQAAAGLLRAAATAALPGRGAAAVGPPPPPSNPPPPPHLLPPTEQSQLRRLREGERARHVAQRRLGWLGQYSGRLASASDGGGARSLRYTSLPRTETEAEAEREAGAAAAAPPPTSSSSFDALGRRWRSAGGAALARGGGGGGGGGSGGRNADGGVVDGWSVGLPYPYRPLADLEAAAAAGEGDNEVPVAEEEEEEGAEEQGSASGRQRQPSTTAEGTNGGGAASSGEAEACSGTSTATTAAGARPPLRLPEVDCSGWRLVVTGHSLGAGAAALLALRLRSALPHVEVRCWAFSPPGSLTSPALSESLRPFTVSVVTGKDLIPRLSLNTMERYRDEMITALARCRCSKARVLVGSFSRRNRLRRAAHLLLPYEGIPPQARRLLRSYHDAVQQAGRLPELHPPGRILYLQPSAVAAGAGTRRGAATSPTSSGSSASRSSTTSMPHYRPVWVSARELLCEGILASTRMLVDHSLTLCTLPALDEILGA